MVMGDGTLQKVDSNHELWWAVRGAGHNFGIVTSITTKIYDVQHAAWAFQNFTFTGDKVQALYTALNDHVLKNGTQSVDVFHYSLFVKVPPIDAEKVCTIKQDHVNSSLIHFSLLYFSTYSRKVLKR